MNSLKQVIVNAIMKVSADPAYAGREYPTSEEARRDFIVALIAELFPECPECVFPSDVQSSGNVDVNAEGGGPVAPAKEKKKRAPKKAPVVEEKTVEEKTPAVVEVPVTEAAPEKKKRAPKAKAADAVNHPKKLNKTEENKVKKLAKELKVEAKDEDVLTYLNGLSAEDYAAKSFDEHVRTFLTPPKETAPVEAVAKRGLLVDFKGKDYWIDPATKKVYETNGSVDEHIGHVGMLEFAEMEIPDHLPENLEEIC